MADRNGEQAERQTFLRRLRRDTRGNTMFLVAASMIPLLGMIGSAVDISRAYMAKLRLQQACDAGVLAGRRAMGGSSFSADSEAEAKKMFNFNFPDGLYGSQDVEFTPALSTENVNEVKAEATTVLPTSIMRVLNFQQFDLQVDCQAKLEIANTDIMLVLDTTGSMTAVNPGDSVSRMDALKDVTVNFFDTISAAQTGDGRIRYGVVPFSSSVNVGGILTDANPDWISDNSFIPSRTANFDVVQDPMTSNTGSFSNGPTSYITAYTNTATYSTGWTSSGCNARTPPANSAATPVGTATTTLTGTTTNAAGAVVRTYTTTQTYQFFNYRYQYQSSSARCYVQQRTGQYVRTTPSSTTTPAPRNVFRNYTYNDITYDVTGIKEDDSMVVPNGVNGAEVTATWAGCIMERRTVPFGVGGGVPSQAIDLDVDMVPTTDDDTKWHMVLPQIAYPRAAAPWLAPSTTGAFTTTADHYDYADPYVNSLGWGVCPSPAMKLTTMTSADRSTFEGYINGLTAVGGTLHDSGMAWGVRLMSPTGLFASENTTAPNGNPISRHLIFMTDGETQHRLGNYGYQGYNYTMNRVGGSTDTELTDRTVRRFHVLCDAAKARNITVWVISFGVAMSPNMSTCASGDKAYQADNAEELEAKFQLIAAQISKLRLSQ